jgi:hypothetical protein
MKELLLIILLVFSLIKFAIDYLSNKLITHNESIIGIVTLLHHIAFSILTFLPLILFIKISNGILLFLLFGIIVGQIMWIVNNDYCSVTQFQNTLINEEYKNYKWIGSIPDIIRKYVRGDEWTYSNIRNTNKNSHIFLGNGILILYCLKTMIINLIN